MGSKKLVSSLVLSASLLSAPSYSQVPGLGASDLGGFAALLELGGSGDILGGLAGIGDLASLGGLGDLGSLSGVDGLLVVPSGSGLSGLSDLGELGALGGFGDLASLESGTGLPIPGFPYGDLLEGVSSSFGQGDLGTSTIELFLAPATTAVDNILPLIDGLASADPEGRFYIPLIEYGMPVFDAVTIAPHKALLRPNGVDFFSDVLEPTVQMGVPFFFFAVNAIYDNGGTEGAALLFETVNDLTGFRLIAKPHDLFRALPFSFVELVDPDLLSDLNDSVGIGLLGITNTGAL